MDLRRFLDVRRFLVIDRWVPGIYGVLIFATISLSISHSLWWLLPNALVGVNFLQQTITGWCPVTYVLRKTGFH